MGKKTIRSLIANYWQVALIGAGALLLVIGLLFYMLQTLIPMASSAESLTINARPGALHSLLANPFFAEHKLLERAAFGLQRHSLFYARAVSAIFALAAVTLMYYILKKWHNTRIACIGTALFATSSWFLTYARLATPEVTYMLIPVALAYGTWMRSAKRPGLVIGIGIIISLYLIYTPGLVWFLVIALIWQRKSIIRKVAEAPRIGLVAITTLAILLVPLAFAIYQQPELYKQWLGVSTNPLNEFKMLPGNLWLLARQLFISGQDDPSIGLTKLPLVDLFTGVMMILGVYYYFLERKLDRAKILAGGMVLGGVLISLQGPVSIVVLLPFIYILASAGVDFMLEQWFRVFPRNPLARNVGLGIVLGAVLLTSSYHLNRYFIAWPRTPETKQAFTTRI